MSVSVSTDSTSEKEAAKPQPLTESESVADLIKEYNEIGTNELEDEQKPAPPNTGSEATRAELEKYLEEMKNKVDNDGKDRLSGVHLCIECPYSLGPCRRTISAISR